MGGTCIFLSVRQRAAGRNAAVVVPGKPVERRGRLRQYELMYILHPQLSDEDLAATIEQVGRYITNLEGEITETIRESPWGRRRLAYTIRHNGQDLRDGFYVLLHFGLENTRRLVEIERALNLNERVVRYLVTKYEAPKPVEEPKQPAEKATVS
jgi:small subunit ribosomal protein S6